MAKACFPSVIYKCKLHCFDTEDESLGDWYEDDPACAVRVYDLSKIEFTIKSILINRFVDRKSNLIDYNEVRQYIMHEIEKLKKLDMILEKRSFTQMSRSDVKYKLNSKGKKYRASY